MVVSVEGIYVGINSTEFGAHGEELVGCAVVIIDHNSLESVFVHGEVSYDTLDLAQ